MMVSFRDWQDSASSCHAAAALRGDHVQVWLASVPGDEAGLAAFAQLLSPDECARADRFRVSVPRRQFIVGRAILRQLLGACMAVDPSAVTFEVQARGKMVLSQAWSRRDLCFNVSHSGRLVAIALARGRDVGIDVEWMERSTDWSLLVDRIFSARERSELEALPASQQRTAFFGAWTRKEAYLKATGQGLIDALGSIEVSIAPEDAAMIRALPGGEDEVRQWAINAIPLPQDFAGAVVFREGVKAG
jgi:4'-phosphopantetheinyl transferase